ncbi:MAG: response regulator [Gemmatimonadota bacterium]|nr:response regulator [Gemmatimonadota bacterium]MDH4347450.1 response regulator [Gemmatimonadota bacterium]MDH5282333.1 response regulator [Gemmatimonadota bacterium]
MGRQLLLVEDDPDQRRLLERTLTAAGWRVLSAPDGEAGVAAARAHRPDVIVLDVMMPRLNGFQACRQLRADPETRHIPIVMTTAKDQPADEFWGREVGADEYLVKPLDIRQLIEVAIRLTEPK